MSSRCDEDWDDILSEGDPGKPPEEEFHYDPPMHGLRCPVRPERLRFASLGQYHCEVCGMMVLAGVKHPVVNNHEDSWEYARLARHLHFVAVDDLKQKGLL